jgi:phosphonopyruvate decarboxylase
MIAPGMFMRLLERHGVVFFTGVPDSLLKHFCFYLDEHAEAGNHIITANEGNAIALAAGYHLATGKIGGVYLQNSGLGNTINPLVSLTDPDVYRIPLIMIIGWRGEPGTKDEPQHMKQGRITLHQLDLLGVPYWIIGPDDDPEIILEAVFKSIHATGSPAALVVRKGSFAEYQNQKSPVDQRTDLLREDALRKLLAHCNPQDIVISTTGKTSRELFELRSQSGELPRDFLSVGSMGHVSSIALGVALGTPGKKVICLDGDGSALMHFGALPVIGNIKPQNFIHVLLNNGAHESVGGQQTATVRIDFRSIAISCGYRHYYRANDLNSIEDCWHALSNQQGPIFFEIKTCIGSRDDLGRPDLSPEANKHHFIDHVRDKKKL